MVGSEQPYDVVIVGAGLAGCTAATLYGRAGLSVALLDKHRSPDTAKALCGHFILAGTQPTLHRLGLRDRMLAAGAIEGPVAMHTGDWTLVDDSDLPLPISLRRTKLDPMVRELAASTLGVDLLLGHTLIGLLVDRGTVTGVRARTSTGEERLLHAPLVVGADGYRSKTAELAGVAEDVLDNQRFGVMAYFRGVRPRAPGVAQVWAAESVAICTPTDDGLTLLAAFPHRRRLEEFRADPAGMLERFLAEQPDGPDLSAAQRVSKVAQAYHYPQLRRDPTPRDGLALVGDAATTGDPVPAVGCGWAFRSGEWLADATSPALTGTLSLRRGLARYRRAHRFIDQHDRLCRSESRAEPPGGPERLILRGMTRDAELRRAVYLLRMRAVPVAAVQNPATLARAAWVTVRDRSAARGGRAPMANGARGAAGPMLPMRRDPPGGADLA
jgi:menaquinone-9 beta-reductase